MELRDVWFAVINVAFAGRCAESALTIVAVAVTAFSFCDLPA